MTPAKSERPLDIPSPPRLLAAILRAASGPDASVQRLAQLVSNDPAVAIQVLKIVNSPLYSRGRKVTSVPRAVAVLGTRALRNVALCVTTSNCIPKRELGEFDLGRFWEDSLRRAVACQVLADVCPEYKVDPAEAFTAGLLQDIGLLALIRTRPERSGEWMKVVGEPPDVRREREIELFGMSHEQAGAALAKLWDLPDELAAPMCHHHDLAQAPASHRHRSVLASHAELIASVFSCTNRVAALTEARRQLAANAGLDQVEVDGLISATGDHVQEAAANLGINVGAQPSLEDILMEANRGLLEMNLSYEEVVKKLEIALAEKDAMARELEARNRMLEQLSLTDALTGLPNRRAFWGRLTYELGRTSRGGSMIMLVADIDHFKRVNDTWGHDFGDQILQSVALTLGQTVREVDMVARIGGEEFAILLPSTDMEGGQVVCRKLLTAVSSNECADPRGLPCHFTISIGLAAAIGAHLQSFDADEMSIRLYKAADRALYRAKQGGRNRAVSNVRPVPWNPPADGSAGEAVAKAASRRTGSG